MNTVSTPQFFVKWAAWIGFSIWLVMACQSTETSQKKHIQQLAKQFDATQYEAGWSIPDAGKRAVSIRSWDLLHKKMWIDLNFEQSKVVGQVELQLAALRSGIDTLRIDAKRMQIKRTQFLKSTGFVPLNFDYSDSNQVIMVLPKCFNRLDTIVVKITYETTHPARVGFAFNNADGKDELLPRQFWTLGQPEDNSYWLPTIDHPAERTTHELWVSSPSAHTNISNGRLLHSQSDEKRRTDYFFMDKAHAPYLIFLASGVYARKREVYKNVVLEYYTEPQFATYMDQIFNPTKKALDYMQSLTGMSYPYEMYRQVVVNNYAAKGMENTTTSLLFDRVQFDDKAASELSNRNLIVHELAHHWFGNTLGIDDWSQLGLNEGFARFAEWDFLRKTDGEEAAAFLFQSYMQKYLAEARKMRRSIITTHYSHPDDLFDAHSYEKSGMAFIMLQQLLGEERFEAMLQDMFSIKGLRVYTLSLIQELAEQQWGSSLEWFFNQWWKSVGHPEVNLQWKQQNNQLHIQVRQVHDMNRQPLFVLPLSLTITAANTFLPQKEVFWLTTPDTVFVVSEVDTLGEVTDVQVNALGNQLLLVHETISKEQFKSRINIKQAYVRWKALHQLWNDDFQSYIDLNALKTMVLSDESEVVREEAMALITEFQDSPDSTFITQALKAETSGKVRIQIGYQLERDTTEWAHSIFRELLNDKSYFVAAEAIKMISRFDNMDDFDAIVRLAQGYSYQNVLRRAAAQSLIHFTNDLAIQWLLTWASQSTDHPVRQDALRSLLQHKNKLNSEQTADLEAILLSIDERRFPASYKIGKEHAIIDALLNAQDPN